MLLELKVSELDLIHCQADVVHINWLRLTLLVILQFILFLQSITLSKNLLLIYWYVIMNYYFLIIINIIITGQTILSTILLLYHIRFPYSLVVLLWALYYWLNMWIQLFNWNTRVCLYLIIFLEYFGLQFGIRINMSLLLSRFIKCHS